MFKISIFVVLVFVAVVNAFKPFPLKKLVAGVIVAGVTFSPALADQVFEKRAKYEIGAGVHRTIDDTDIQIQRKKEKFYIGGGIHNSKKERFYIGGGIHNQ